MASNFEKRKAKQKQEVVVLVENVTLQEGDELVGELTHTGFDIYLGPDGRTYQAVTFKYNPVTQDVEIAAIQPISRQVGLSYENSKRALVTLMKY